MEPKKIDQEHKYQCRICNKGFSWERDYEEHIRTHGFKDEIFTEKEEVLPTAVAGGESAADMSAYNRELLTWNSYFKRDYSSSSTAAAAAGDDDGDRDGLSPPSPPCFSHKGKRIKSDRENCSSTDRQAHSRTQEEDVAHFLLEFSKACVERAPVPNQNHPATPAGYKCDNCNKVFQSHQALGGHRASHKNVKGCYAAGLEIRSSDANNTQIERQNNNVDNQNNMVRSSPENMALSIVPLAEYWPRSPFPPRKYSKPHICKECPRQFPTGQALGGHMRCHRKPPNITAAVAVNPTIATAPTTDAEVRASSIEVSAVQPRSPTLVPPLFNRPYRNIDLNVEPESSDDMDGSPLRLRFSDPKPPEPASDTEPKRKMDLGEEEDGPWR